MYIYICFSLYGEAEKKIMKREDASFGEISHVLVSTETAETDPIHNITFPCCPLEKLYKQLMLAPTNGFSGAQ